jgi:hypothetical protein
MPLKSKEEKKSRIKNLNDSLNLMINENDKKRKRIKYLWGVVRKANKRAGVLKRIAGL